MIVKFKNSQECWNYFEGDNVIQHEIDLENSKLEQREDTLIIIDSEILKHEQLGLELCILKEKRVIGRIITNKSTYLMNDNGKTIDKLI